MGSLASTIIPDRALSAISSGSDLIQYAEQDARSAVGKRMDEGAGLGRAEAEQSEKIL